MGKCIPRFLQTGKKIFFLAALFFVSGFSLQFVDFNSLIQDFLPKEALPQTYGVEGERVFASKVVDGDTVELSDGRVVRLLGIDTPETVDPKRPVGCFGKEAAAETKNLLSGREFVIQKDVSDKDKYGRLLRLIFLPLPDGEILFVNDYLVREGLATVLTYPPDVKYNERLREAETEAKASGKGLWGKCF